MRMRRNAVVYLVYQTITGDRMYLMGAFTRKRAAEAKLERANKHLTIPFQLRMIEVNLNHWPYEWRKDNHQSYWSYTDGEKNIQGEQLMEIINQDER